MDIYSDWILVDDDRSCGLDKKTKVIVLYKSSTPEQAEKYEGRESWRYREYNGKWMNYIFAYKKNLTPEKREAAYKCYVGFNPESSPVFYDEEEAPAYVKMSRDYEYGIAKEVSINGRPISFHWEKSTK